MPAGTQQIKLLAALVDTEDEEESEYRFLVDDKHVKYVTTDPGSLAGIHRSFAPDLLRTLPEFPPGDWNEGRISKDERTGRAFFSSLSASKLPAVACLWHPTSIDHLELKEVARLRQNVHEVRHASFGDETVIFKFAPFPWQIPFLEAETRAYGWIRDINIAPKFLAHVTEGGRVVGFLLEHINGASAATLEDLDACRTALHRLHSLGIKHGDVNRNNFLVKPGVKVAIIDLEMTRKCEDKDQLENEFAGLEESFRDPSNRGGVVIVSE